MPEIITPYGTWDLPAQWDANNGYGFRAIDSVDGMSVVRLLAPALALTKQAEDARDAAQTAAGSTGGDVTAAEAARDGAVTAQGLSEAARDTSVAAAGASEGFRDEAEEFAIDTAGEAEGGSAKSWAQTAEDADVPGAAGGSRSALHYAAKAAASAAGVNLPPIEAGDAGYFLRVKGDETGYDLTEANAAVGDPVALVDVAGNPGLPAVDGSLLTGISSGLVPIGAPVVASNVAAADIEFPADGTYDNYILLGTGITLADDGRALVFQMKIGGSYVTSGYFYHTSEPASDAATYVGTNSASAAQIRIGTLGNAAGEHADIKIEFANPASTTLIQNVRYSAGIIGNSGQAISVTGSGACATTGALTGIRFFAISASNIATGTFQLYGIKKGS